MMKIWKTRLPAGLLMTAVVWLMLFALPFATPDSYGEAVRPPLSHQEQLRLGERMYREGILPSGEPMQAYVKGDIPVTGTAFTCVSCHQRSGLGSEEGGVFTPPTSGPYLFEPPRVISVSKYSHAAPRRPVYTDESLAAMLRGGVDSGGRVLDFVMPRYHLQDGDMAILITYLKSLSAQPSPGVSDTTIHFATVVTDDVSPEDRNAMLASLDKFIAFANGQANYYRKKAGTRSARMAERMLLSTELAYKRLTLTHWVLHGPPGTWRGQLEEYYRKDPVFALVGGITAGDWRPIHQFSEDNRIPCILPSTNLPVVSATDWYTLYFSKGFYQEGEAVARYLNGMGDSLQDKRIVQIVRASREGRALSDGFQAAWQEAGRKAPQTIGLKAGEALTPDMLRQATSGKQPTIIILWDGPGSVAALETLAGAGNRPKMVFVSSSYLGDKMWTLGEQVRDFTYLAYPYRPPQDEARLTGVTKAFTGPSDTGNARVIGRQMYSTVRVLSQALMDMKGNYFRDNLLDVIGMGSGMAGMVLTQEQEQSFPLYERLSFGPGQRYASKGCYIVQLGKGAKPELVKKSEWVIH